MKKGVKITLTVLIIFIVLCVAISLSICFKNTSTLEILLNYGISIPSADKVLYSYNSGGRDENIYSVIKYDEKKLEKIKNLNWQRTLKYQTMDSNLESFLVEYKVPKKYYPIYDENSMYFIKNFSDKEDYIIIIYNTKNKLTYIYQFHI